MGFTDMQREAPELALEWRMQTRELFETYFRRGYRAVDFFLDRPHTRGRYLLATKDAGQFSGLGETNGRRSPS